MVILPVDSVNVYVRLYHFIHACRRRFRQSGVTFVAAVSYQKRKGKISALKRIILMLQSCFDGMRLHLT